MEQRGRFRTQGRGGEGGNPVARAAERIDVRRSGSGFRSQPSSREAPSILATILFECGGTLVVLYALSEVFRDIFHPTRSGNLSEWVGRGMSQLLRHTRFREAVGPLALVCVILCWDCLITGGFALIYCGALPGTAMGPGAVVSAGTATRYLQSLYFSLGAFDTFKTFNLDAETNGFRLIVAVEGLIGITMITASVSWLVLLYPAYARSRQFGRRVATLLEAEKRAGTAVVEAFGAALLLDLANGVLQYRLDVVLFPILLHFYPAEESATLAHILPDLQKMAAEAKADERKESRMAGIQLQISLEGLAQVLARRVLQMEGGDLGEVFRAFQQREQ